MIVGERDEVEDSSIQLRMRLMISFYGLVASSLLRSMAVVLALARFRTIPSLVSLLLGIGTDVILLGDTYSYNSSCKCTILRSNPRFLE